jgi:lipoprotein-anchoring transpeptidase ErfK/SrfK
VTRRRGALLAAGAAAAAALAATAGAGAGSGANDHAPPRASVRATASARGLPAPVRPAFTPGRPERLHGVRFVSRWAPVVRTTTALARPERGAPAVTEVETRTPEDTANVVLVIGSRVDAAGRLWVHARLATLPNGRTGWLPRSALGGYGTVDTELRVDTARLTATLLVRGRAVLRAPVGIGQRRWPTPRGRFYVRDELTKFAGATYGPLAFGTSARSAVLTDWPAGGFVGIHGTDRPDLIPGRVSHGCIRMRNADILRLARLMPVGTPLTVV